MTGRFVQLHLFLARHRGKLLVAIALFTAAAAWMGTKLRMNEDFTDILPLSAPGIAEQIEGLKHIRQAEQLYVDVATAGTNSAQLVEAASQMTAALRAIPQLAEVRGEIAATDLAAVYVELQAQLPGLLNSNDLRELEPRLTSAGVESRLAWLKQAMLQPQGLLLKNVAQTDPAGLSDTVSARLRDLQPGGEAARIVDGYITSADGAHALLQATPAFRSSETGRSGPLIAALAHAAQAVTTNFPAGAVKISIVGAHLAAFDNARIIQRDTTWTSILATVAITVLIVAVCRRRWLAVLALVPVLFGALGALVFFYFTGGVVSAVALGCGSMLIGVAVDYGIFVVYRLDDEPTPTREELARAVARMVPAVSFGALTTMAAFFVMFLSPVSGHQQLGLFGVVGVGLAALFALLILPVFIPVQPGLTAGPLPLTVLLQKIFAWRARHPGIVLPALVIFTLVCAAGACRLRFDGDLDRLNGVTAATRQQEAAVRAAWSNSLGLTSIVVEGATREEALAKNEQIFAVLSGLREQKQVDSFSSIARLAPSPQTRAANVKAWRDFWTVRRQTDLHEALAAAAAKLGFRTQAFAPFLATLAAPPMVTNAFGPALNRLTADFWSGREGQFYLTTLVKVGDTGKFRQLRAAVKAVVPDALLINRAALAEDITRVARQALPEYGVLVALLNAWLLYLLLGRIELVLVALLPMAAGIFWTMGTLGLCGLPVDVANFVFVIFVVGVGGDYSLFLLLGELEPLRGRPERAAATAAAVTMCATTALLGTGVLVLSRHPALFSVGLTALLGISYSLAATLLLVPLTLRWLAAAKLRRPDLVRPTAPQLRRAVGRLYHLQGAYASHFAYWKLRTDPLFRVVEQAVPPRGDILDAGCGFGLVAHWLTLAAPERRVRGVDFDPYKIQVAQATARANPRVHFAKRNLLEAAELPACDCALLCDVLHYFPDEHKAAVLKRVFLALRPGGRLVIRDALAQDHPGHRAVMRSEKMAVRLGQNHTQHGLHFADAPTHLAWLSAAGFVEVEVQANVGRGSNALITATKPAC